MLEVFKSKSAHVTYDPSTRIIKIIWTGFVRLEDFKQAMLAAFDAFVINDAYHWLIDQTNRQAVSNDINEWVVKEIFPKMIEAAKPFTRTATVLSKDVFGRFTMKTQATNLVETFQEKVIPFQYFENAEEAQKWLVKHNPEL